MGETGKVLSGLLPYFPPSPGAEELVRGNSRMTQKKTFPKSTLQGARPLGASRRRSLGLASLRWRECSGVRIPASLGLSRRAVPLPRGWGDQAAGSRGVGIPTFPTGRCPGAVRRPLQGPGLASGVPGRARVSSRPPFTDGNTEAEEVWGGGGCGLRRAPSALRRAGGHATAGLPPRPFPPGLPPREGPGAAAVGT